MLDSEKTEVVKMDKGDKLTKAEFEKLLIKASQPLPAKVEQPDSSKERTSESQSSGDCNESHTR